MATYYRESAIASLKSHFEGLQIWWNVMSDRYEFWIDYRENKITEYMIYFEIESFEKLFRLIQSIYRDIDYYLDAVWC
jgi:hypothetical protein